MQLSTTRQRSYTTVENCQKKVWKNNTTSSPLGDEMKNYGLTIGGRGTHRLLLRGEVEGAKDVQLQYSASSVRSECHHGVR